MTTQLQLLLLLFLLFSTDIRCVPNPERRSHLHRGGSLKYRISTPVFPRGNDGYKYTENAQLVGTSGELSGRIFYAEIDGD